MNQVEKLKAQIDTLEVRDQASLRKQRSLLGKLLRTGTDIRGYSNLIRSHGSHLTRLVGSWARRRGRNFELEVMRLIQGILDKEQDSGVVHRCATERYGVQPYDLVLYLRGRRPIFLECKAGGFQENSRSYVVDKNSRSMKNIPERMAELQSLILRTQAPYFFVYPKGTSIVMVPARLILTPRGRVTIPKDKAYVLGDQSCHSNLILAYESQIKV